MLRDQLNYCSYVLLKSMIQCLGSNQDYGGSVLTAVSIFSYHNMKNTTRLQYWHKPEGVNPLITKGTWSFFNKISGLLFLGNILNKYQTFTIFHITAVLWEMLKYMWEIIFFLYIISVLTQPWSNGITGPKLQPSVSICTCKSQAF